MKRNIDSDKNNFFNFEKFSHEHEFGAQPRKSDGRSHKSARSGRNHFDDDDERFHHGQRDEPNKNRIRVQLRRIERLF